MAFKLSPLFLSQYAGKQPKWGFGDLSYFVYKRTYARIMPDGTQEEYSDTCRRVTEGVFSVQKKHCHSNRLPWNAHKAQKTAQEFFRRMWDFKFTPPGRGFWIMGTPIVDKIGSAALNNCGFRSTKGVKVDFGAPFSWAMDMLMLGVGVGFDTKGADSIVIKQPKERVEVYQIGDDREGWVESIYLLINSYTGGPTYTFDYSLIRPRGAPIKGFGGTASGPAPLEELHNSIRRILNALVGLRLTSVAIVDLFNLIGKCVVAGNVRRSAELGIGNIDDEAYMSMKDYDKFPEELLSHRWASNNSVSAEPYSDFTGVSVAAAKNGEPGLVFISNMNHYGRFKDGFIDYAEDRYDDAEGTNPCGEQPLEDKELCTLVETYPANHESVEDYHITLKFAYMYAKTITLIPTHDEGTNAVMMRNRRIGCSMSGIQQAIKKFGLYKFLHEFCDKGYETIRRWDRIYSRWLGIPRSLRMTTVKPSGTVSILAGATPGVHFTHSEFYMRLVRISAASPLLLPILLAGYRIELAVTDNEKLGLGPDVIHQVSTTEDLKMAADKGTTLVVYFPIKEKNFTKSKFDTTLWEQLAIVREMQYYWSDNAVSCTVTVKKEEASQLNGAIEFYAPYVKTLSFLPLTDHKYTQAPYTECNQSDYEDYNNSLGGLYLDTVAESNIKGSKFCTSDKCEI